MRIRFRASIFASTVLFASAGAAIAQDVGGAMDMTGMGIYAMEDSVMDAAQGTVTRSGPAARRSVRPAAVRLDFRPSIEQRKKNLAQFVAKSRKRDPQGAAQLEKLFASGDVIGQINREIGRYGFRTNDVADAYAAWWINAWLASRGRTDDPSRQQIAAVRAQAAQAMASLPQMANASDAVKQEMTEAYLVQTALIGSHLEQARGNPAQLRKIGAAVRQGARASGLDLGAMELTDEGFVPARSGAVEGSGPSPAANDAAPVAVASKQENAQPKTGYVVGGAAAVAAIGGAYAMGTRKARQQRG